MKEEQREADERDEWSAIDDIIFFFLCFLREQWRFYENG